MDEEWPSDWLRGVLETMALAVVSEGETYGYLIAAQLADAGMGTIKGGTLYPVLNRLERERALSSQWRQGDGGPGRKYYRITGAGRDRLEEQRARWHTFTERASSIMRVQGNGAEHDHG
ncbi:MULTISPECIES: PadR family transcriptional regulator [unclassified Pseudactinotalea]|uniref:PadR family transcriptional regulator n=1 Tax=unclassified Pseudactinotalea TaxID=2649176 RepID=UPI00128C56F0|nr:MULTISPECIES: PadR family transcriptional regulator [unclassified Pseudactinotalea]MPV51226.1 PadR family transcriptional regulator [Pseudactinotalea sp. HY160]QGH69691.1 PadR family transcriptional regulator [Pseudactinotalea sp. HY158]